MQSIKGLLKRIYLSPHVQPVLHTFWQVALPALIAQLFLVRSTADVKAAFIAAAATGLAAVKAVYLAKKG